MGIQNFPAVLQPIIQQGYLEREFQDGLQSNLTFRAVADREMFPNKVGETLTKTRTGLLAPSTTPLAPSANTGLDNGLTPQNWTVEQYVLGIQQYAQTMDLNVITQKVGIVEQFLQNAKKLGIQSKQSLDRLAREKLFSGYLGGNTKVATTLGAPALSIAVDNVIGFEFMPSNGVMAPVSNSNPMDVYVGSNQYSLVSVSKDVVNVSSLAGLGGWSGTLTFSGNVTVADGTAGKPVVSKYAPSVLRANARKVTDDLIGSDQLTVAILLDAVTQLRNNNVPEINGKYNVYLDATSMRQIFSDPEFQLLYRGNANAPAMVNAEIVELVDLRFIRTTEAPQQTLGSNKIHRPIVVGQGALIEGVFEGQADLMLTGDSVVSVVDDVLMIVREPLDRLQQNIAQSWSYIGGFALPTDVTATKNIIPTASDAFLKRAVVIEHA